MVKLLVPLWKKSQPSHTNYPSHIWIIYGRLANGILYTNYVSTIILHSHYNIYRLNPSGAHKTFLLLPRTFNIYNHRISVVQCSIYTLIIEQQNVLFMHNICANNGIRRCCMFLRKLKMICLTWVQFADKAYRVVCGLGDKRWALCVFTRKVCIDDECVKAIGKWFFFFSFFE